MTDSHDLPLATEAAGSDPIPAATSTAERASDASDADKKSPADSTPADLSGEKETDASANSEKKSHFAFKPIFFGACIVIAIAVFCIANADKFSAVVSKIGGMLSPILIGLVIAYLCNPILKFYERVFFRRMKKGNLRRALSLLLTVLTVIAFFALIIALVVPELVRSIGQLIENAPQYLDTLLGFVQKIIDSLTANFQVDIDISDTEKLQNFLVEMFGSMEKAMQSLLKPLQDMVLDKSFFDNIWGFITGLISTLTNLILGIFIAFYILSSKEKRVAQINKFRAAYLSDKQESKLSEVLRLVNRTFSCFVRGVLLDALAVGVVTFILLSIFRVSEYNLLIAVICAITNIIPFFGPFIGAIPSGLIVLISNPSKLLVFIILILVIQQIEGNIIYPMIQGNSTGISSLAVLISITVMGEMFGVLGMIIGVPIFAVVIELVKQTIENRLKQRGRPTDTTYYYPANAVGDAEEDVYYEHSHWRYKYHHSKLKVRIDKARARFARKRKIKAKWKKRAKATKQKDHDEPTAPPENTGEQ